MRMSWNTHAIMTRAALRSERSSLMDRRLPVVELEDFLSEVGEAIQVVIRWYWDLLNLKIKSASQRVEPPAEIRSVELFLEALRINPNYRIPYVKVVPLDRISPAVLHDPSRAGPPGGSYIETPPREEISALEILCAFSDEPDWGMDQDLFLIDRYGYGRSPYGGESGQSSQAPFHMAFLFESPLLLGGLPQLRRSFLEERVRIFFALGQLAFKHGVEYWGWRFTAWAMHYLQDLTQPYHARAFPFPILKILGRFLAAGDFTSFAEKNENFLRNRHMLFEAAVHFLLNDAVKRYSTHHFLPALADSGEADVATVKLVIKSSARIAANMATEINQSLVALMADPRLDDPDYFIGDDRSYRIEESLPEAARRRPDIFRRFTELVKVCLLQTGKVTRFCVRRMEAL